MRDDLRGDGGGLDRVCGMKMTKHHLLTITVAPNMHMHTYLMAPDNRRYVEAVVNKMLDEAEKIGLHPIPIILSTELSKKGVEIVRTTINKNNEEAGRTLADATDYHVSTWMMPDDHPDNAALMKLH
jgi:hypothetical protein